MYSQRQGRTGPPGTCQVGQLVRRPRGPPRQMLQEGVERKRGSGDLRYGGRALLGKYLQGPGVPSFANGAGLPN